MKLTWEQVAQRDPRTRPLVMGHRGSPDERAENTLGSFALALEQGADVLETDLRFTRDNVIVLMHDETVARTTDGSGEVAGMTLAELKQLHAHRAPMFAKDGDRDKNEGKAGQAQPGDGEPPPTLEELLQMTRGEVPLALELKDDRFLNPRDAGQLIELLSSYNAIESSVLVSFSLARMQTFRPLAPGLRIGLITLSNPFPLPPTEFLGPYYPLLYANPLYVAWARRLGRIVCPLDIAPEPRLGYYRRLGLMVVMTNHPGETVQALQRLYR
ncbi:MAG: glycerophosphodiester phosphodiesterase [Rudaea sp.]